MSTPWVIRAALRCKLGEGPLWSARENAIYWVDILAPAVHRLELSDGSVQSWPMPERIGWLVEREHAPGFIAGLQSGFAELSLDPFSIQPIADPEPHLPTNRMNDCKVDAAGRIWAGTMDAAIKDECGSLYRLDPGFRVSKHDEGYGVTNGPAFSVDCRTMYHTDTLKRTVFAFPLREDGSLGKRKDFIRFRDEWGYPDGMTVDAEGGLWIAHWGHGCVSRFTPDGERERSIELPASQITSCVFAGPALDRMFVTSAADGQLDAEHAGKLFEINPGVRGVPQPRFAG
jgi:sugar lactone lactonase YvrE